MVLQETPKLLNERKTAIDAIFNYLSNQPVLVQRLIKAAQSYKPEPEIRFSYPLELELETNDQIILEEDGVLFIKKEQLELWSANGYSLYGKLPGDTPIEIARIAMKFYRHGQCEGERMGRFNTNVENNIQWLYL